MKRFLAAMLAAMVVFAPQPAVAEAESTSLGNTPLNPFEVIPQPAPARQSHLGSTLCFVTGAVMIAGSYALAHRADDAYSRYLEAQSPAALDHWFDESTRFDRWSSGAIMGGEAVIVAGVYLRFLRRPRAALALVMSPGSCALSLHF